MGDRIDGYATALLAVAEAEGDVERVERELFNFARTFESNDQLRSTLTDGAIPVDRRQAVIEELLGGRASHTTVNLVSFVVGAGRARDLPAIVDKIVSSAAASRNAEVAEVR